MSIHEFGESLSDNREIPGYLSHAIQTSLDEAREQGFEQGLVQGVLSTSQPGLEGESRKEALELVRSLAEAPFHKLAADIQEGGLVSKYFDDLPDWTKTAGDLAVVKYLAENTGISLGELFNRTMPRSRVGKAVMLLLNRQHGDIDVENADYTRTWEWWDTPSISEGEIYCHNVHESSVVHGSREPHGNPEDRQEHLDLLHALGAVEVTSMEVPSFVDLRTRTTRFTSNFGGLRVDEVLFNQYSRIEMYTINPPKADS